MEAHQLDVIASQPESPVQRRVLLALHHLLTQSQCLGIDVVVVYRVVYRTLDAVHYPGRVTAVLLVGDKLLAVGGSAERGTMGQFGAILVVGTADGESELREIALEGTQVLAENRLKLVEAYRRLAAESLHEVLVGIVARGIVEEILAQRRRKEIG